MKKRIYLKDIGITHLPIDSQTPIPPSEIPPTPVNDIDLKLEGTYAPGFEPSVSAIVTDANGYTHTAINGFPERSLSIAIPSEDMPRVKAWFSGNYTGVENPASATLGKNVSTAVSGFLSDYISACQNHNLFTSPCRFAWCCVTKNGIRSKLNPINPAQPNPEAPLLPIINHYFTDTHLHTRVQIRNIPCLASLKIDSADLAELLTSGFETIEICATRQVEFRSIKSEIFGINSTIIDGTPKKCWSYDHYSADEIGNSVNSDSNFRCICRISVTDLPEDNSYLILPISSALLANFNTAPIYKENSEGPQPNETDKIESLSNTDSVSRWVHFVTEPLDLGYPEDDKHMNRITLYGIFPRVDPDKISLTLCASHHRESWHTIASTHGYILHGLRRVPFRWWRVEIKLELRPGDTLEALTFEF